jgi:hypothetical protein
MRIRSMNGFERLRGQIKRRTRAIGASPTAPAPPLITAVALQVTSIWRDRISLDTFLLTRHHATAACTTRNPRRRRTDGSGSRTTHGQIAYRLERP